MSIHPSFFLEVGEYYESSQDHLMPIGIPCAYGHSMDSIDNFTTAKPAAQQRPPTSIVAKGRLKIK
jgi:hypothetical protein